MNGFRFIILGGCGVCLILSGSCAIGTATSSAIVSATSSAVAVIGGAINASSSSGTRDIAWDRLRTSTACPTFSTAPGSGCAQVGDTYSLSYANCSFGSSTALWNGTEVATLQVGSASCGSFPRSTFTRTFAWGTTRTDKNGVVVTLDTSLNANNFEQTTVGGGVTISMAGGVRTGISISGIKVTSGSFDETVLTQMPLTVTDNGTTQTVNGTLQVLHNLEGVRGNTTLSNLEFTRGCCYPTEGKLITLFDGGSLDQNTGSSYVGKTETLTFNGSCGQATYQDINGRVSSVELTHCF